MFSYMMWDMHSLCYSRHLHFGLVTLLFENSFYEWKWLLVHILGIRSLLWNKKFKLKSFDGCGSLKPFILWKKCVQLLSLFVSTAKIFLMSGLSLLYISGMQWNAWTKRESRWRVAKHWLWMSVLCYLWSAQG